MSEVSLYIRTRDPDARPTRLVRVRARDRASRAASRRHARVERARDVRGDVSVHLARRRVSSPEPRATRRVDARDAAQGAAQKRSRAADARSGAPGAAESHTKL